MYDALYQGYRSKSTLFVALWRSSHDASEDDEEGPAAETDWEILNENVWEKMRAFAWVDSGCPPLH